MHNVSVWQKQQKEQAETENENFKTQQEAWVQCTYGPRRSEMERNCTWLTCSNPISSCGDWLVGRKEGVTPNVRQDTPSLYSDLSGWRRGHPDLGTIHIVVLLLPR